MRKTLVIGFIVLIVSTFSCKKIVQQKEESAALNIITNGTWYVKQYLQDSIDITYTLSTYTFQFKTNGTVIGYNDSVSVTGTWSANIGNLTITSAFPANSGALNELNGIWKITNSTTVSVVANATVNSNINDLTLQKN